MKAQILTIEIDFVDQQETGRSFHARCEIDKMMSENGIEANVDFINREANGWPTFQIHGTQENLEKFVALYAPDETIETFLI